MFNKFNFLLSKFTAKGAGRPELGGIYFSPKETCATDSFTLVRIKNPVLKAKDYPMIENSKPLINFKPFILPSSEAEEILKRIPKVSSIPLLENAFLVNQEKNQVEFITSDSQNVSRFKTLTIRGEYPNYKRILRKKGRQVKVSVNIKFLKRIINFLGSFNENQELKMEIPIDQTQPLRFYGKRDGQEAEVLLMPILEK